jgi:hypothetical protein
MKAILIKELAEEQENIIIYNRNVNQYYYKLKDNYRCIYFDEPIPVRIKLVEILDTINPDYKYDRNHITIAELKEVILKELGADKLIILFNNFEKLNKRALNAYEYLNKSKNVRFICSFKNRFKNDAYNFYKTFKFINNEDYPYEENMKKINITYTISAILSLVCILVYLKTSASIYMATIIIGALWFGLIIFRTLMYAGGRI